PGYVGYEEGGQLTEAVRRRPFSVVLFDEIEKAHPEIFNVLLQILDDGRLTDAQGRAVDFKNAVIIMTSNVGAPLLEKEVAIGFKPTHDQLTAMDSAYTRMKDHITEELRRTFRPEFLNRIDEVIIFRPLTGLGAERGNAATRERGAPESDSEEGPVTNRAFLLQGHM